MYALAIYFQGPQAYRFLAKQFVLPSTRLLRKNMNRIRMHPGFHESVLCVLKEVFRTASSSEKLCVISFDDMTIRSKITYLRGDDAIEGTEDFGSFGRSTPCANHALVFMVPGAWHHKEMETKYGLFSLGRSYKGRGPVRAFGAVCHQAAGSWSHSSGLCV